MTSFNACLCLIEEIIGEEEFVLLYEAYRPSNLLFLCKASKACDQCSHLIFARVSPTNPWSVVLWAF